MTRSMRTTGTVATSVLLCLPATSAFLSGQLGLGAIGVRHALAAALGWCSIVGLERIVDLYRPDRHAAVVAGGDDLDGTDAFVTEVRPDRRAASVRAAGDRAEDVEHGKSEQAATAR